MKIVALLALVLAACSASVIQDPSAGYREGDRYFYFPGDGDGILHFVDGLEPPDERVLSAFTRNPLNTGYWLYTRDNPDTPQIIEFGNEESLRNSNFDHTKCTVFLVHGWNGHGNNEMNKLLTEAFLTDGDVNVFVIDWSALANRSYSTARKGVPAVGERLGHFIDWLTTLGLSYDNTHLVGFSLGGHLVGNAGRATDGRVRRLTALDPAGPWWSGDENKLRKSDAQYVEVIHTNTGLYGYADPLGDIDFYPNGGNGMPGCWLNTCSHGKAFHYMAATVKHNHLLARQCASPRDASRNNCSDDVTYFMGNSFLNKERTGIFRVDTGKNYPY